MMIQERKMGRSQHVLLAQRIQLRGYGHRTTNAALIRMVLTTETLLY